MDAQEPQKMLVFLGYVFNEHNLVEYMKVGAQLQGPGRRVGGEGRRL